VGWEGNSSISLGGFARPTLFTKLVSKSVVATESQPVRMSPYMTEVREGIEESGDGVYSLCL